MDDLAVVIDAIPSSQLVADDVTGNVGETVQLSATLTSAGSPLEGKTVDFQVDGAPAGSATTDASGVASLPYTIPSMGDKTISAGFAGDAEYLASSDDADLTAVNNVTTIGLFLSRYTVVAGESTVATVVDAAGNIITASSLLSIQGGAGGAWAANVYTSHNAGTWTVTAVYGAYTATAPLTVTHAGAAALDISPDSATITTAGSQTYTAVATDALGNTWAPAPGDVTWSSSGAGSFAGATYTPDAADAGQTLDIQGSLDGLDSDVAKLTVNAAGGVDLFHRHFHAVGNRHAPAFDRAGQVLVGPDDDLGRRDAFIGDLGLRCGRQMGQRKGAHRKAQRLERFRHCSLLPVAGIGPTVAIIATTGKARVRLAGRSERRSPRFRRALVDGFGSGRPRDFHSR